jgi:GNAT superfamily N-acetyltransferase
VIRYREAIGADMPDLTRVRIAVTENALTVAQLLAYGITPESIAQSFLEDSKGWVAEVEGRIRGFSIADRKSKSIFALFVEPGYEKRGMGGALLTLAVDWLWANDVDKIWLTTGPTTQAATFYARRGWVNRGRAEGGHDDRYELVRPAA